MALEDYNWFDRRVHRLAFGSKVPQKVLLDLEDKLFGEEINRQELAAPIFITGLPRAGTTLLLELLSKHPDLVSHTYRDMPFVSSPAIWRKVSLPFHATQETKERSHGDGMLVNADSAEAFEEILWKQRFPGHYSDHGIELWSDLPADFVVALQRAMKSLIVARHGRSHSRYRYVSKNNANIGRIEPLTRAFEDAALLLPLRNPLDQARSLLRQHQKALGSHKQSDFARQYVRDVGHFEFGMEHRPILFPGMDDVIARHSPMHMDYWLGYWIAAHRHLASQDGLRIVAMKEFTSGKLMRELLDHLQLEPEPGLLTAAEKLIRPMPSTDDRTDCSEDLLSEAIALFEELRAAPARII